MKKVAKILMSLTLCLVMVIAAIPVMPVAKADSSSGFTYEWSDYYGGLIITDYTYSSATSVTVPSTLFCDEDYYDVVAIGDYAFQGCSSLSSITLPKTLYYIGYKAFDGTAYSNNAANWQDGLLYIGNYLVASSSNLTSCTIKTGTTLIASKTFAYQNSLKTVIFPNLGYDELLFVCDSAFYDCYNIEKVYTPSLSAYKSIYFEDVESNPMFTINNNTVQQVGEPKLYANNTPVTNIDSGNWFPYAFAGCQSITSVNFASEFDSIGEGAFVFCNNLTNVNISGEFLMLEDAVFYASGVTNVSLPYYTPLGGGVFAYTPYYDNQANWTDGVLYAGNSVADSQSTVTSVSLKENVNSVADGAFDERTNLKDITINSTIFDYGIAAFDDCANLKKVYAIDLESWTAAEFWSDSSNPLSNGAGLYFNGVKVTEITVPEDEDHGIDEYEFYGCTSIKTVTAPTGYYVPYSAFDACPNLKTVNFVEGSSEVLDWHDFYFPETTEKVTVGSGITEIAYETLAYYPNLTSISLPSTLEFIGNYGIAENPKLKSLTIPKSVTAIGLYAFMNCSDLESISLPKALKIVGTGAFYGCESLSRVNVADLGAYCNVYLGYDADGVYLYDSPFCYGASLYVNNRLVDDPVIPKSAKYVTDVAFAGCKNIKSVTFNSGVEAVGVGAFYDCVNLKYLNIAKSLDTLYSDAFVNTPVSHINYTGSKTQFYNVFYTGSGVKVHTSTSAKVYRKVKDATTSKSGYYRYYCSKCKKYISSKKSIARIKSAKASSSYTYSGKTITPSFSVKDSSGKTIRSGYYSVSYSTSHKYVGKHKAKLTFKDKYSGKKTVYFTINPPKTNFNKITATPNSISVSINKKQSQVSGYQVQYSTSSKFSSYKTVTLNKYSKTSTTIKSLSKGKTYYVRVRTYKTVSGKKYYSSWSDYTDVLTR